MEIQLLNYSKFVSPSINTIQKKNVSYNIIAMYLLGERKSETSGLHHRRFIVRERWPESRHAGVLLSDLVDCGEGGLRERERERE